MKKILMSLCVLTLSSATFAQAKKPVTRAADDAPDQIVRNLYAAQKTEKTSPFTQVKSRALIDKYFSQDFADLIWKANMSETGWNVDPLYNSQDPAITGFLVGKAKEDGHDGVYLKVSFKSHSKADWVGFSIRKRSDNVWKIDNLDYSDGEDLQSILRYSSDPEFQKSIDADPFKGNYMVGGKMCDVMPTMNGMFHRVTCDGQAVFKLYAVEGTETGTAYVRNEGKARVIDKFVFKTGEADGKFIDAAGKVQKVSKVNEPQP